MPSLLWLPPRMNNTASWLSSPTPRKLAQASKLFATHALADFWISYAFILRLPMIYAMRLMSPLDGYYWEIVQRWLLPGQHNGRSFHAAPITLIILASFLSLAFSLLFATAAARLSRLLTIYATNVIYRFSLRSFTAAFFTFTIHDEYLLARCFDDVFHHICFEVSDS